MKLKNIFNRFAELLHRDRPKVGCGVAVDDAVSEIEQQLSHLKASLTRLAENADGRMTDGIDEMRFRIAETERTVIRLRHEYAMKQCGRPVEYGVAVAPEKPPESSQASEYIGRIDKIIAENIHDVNFGVDTIVNKMLVSRTLLYTRFKEFSGQSIGSYIADYRLRKAKEMLADGDVPINGIASGLGFSNQRYFSTFFKEKTGKSPTEYRRELQNLRISQIKQQL